MSINISAAQQRHSKNIQITYDFNTFGPRQRIAMFRAARTGLLKGNSVSNDIAKGLRSKHGLGSIRFRNYWTEWNGLAPEDFDIFTVAMATMKLEGKGIAKGDFVHIDAKSPNGYARLRGVKPPKMSLGSNPELENLVANIEAGHITELTVPL